MQQNALDPIIYPHSTLSLHPPNVCPLKSKLSQETQRDVRYEAELLGKPQFRHILDNFFLLFDFLFLRLLQFLTASLTKFQLLNRT